MTIYIGENIKHLRREKDITQEKLAEFLGVSFQSVSNWERGETYPDITVLPEIAAFFNVSIDRLLGLNKAEAQNKINEYLAFYDKYRYKNTSLVFEEFRKASKDFPKNYSIMVRYMELLMCEKTEKDSPDYEKTSKEILSIYEGIRDHCNDDSIRMWAKRLACQHLHTKSYYTGNNDYQLEAEKILSEMPDMINSKDYLSTMLITDKDKHNAACRQSIENNIYLLNNTVAHYCYYDDSFSHEYKIGAITKMIDICNIIFSDGNYGKLWHNMIYNHGHLGRLYAETNNYTAALKHFNICADFAEKYDNLPSVSEMTAQFFEKSEYKKIPRGQTMCQRIKYLITEKYNIPDELKMHEEYIRLIARLNDKNRNA